jgi:hypothetical protein
MMDGSMSVCAWGDILIGYRMFDSACYASYGYMDAESEVKTIDGMSVYCACGRIVTLDRKEMMVRLELGKDLECSKCRNQRISMEIDALNDHFSGVRKDENMMS